MKIPFGFKFFDIRKKDGKYFIVFRLKWYYAVYLAIVSVFSSEWYKEICLPEYDERKKRWRE